MNELSIGDGFRFGCGFFLAGFAAWLAVAIIGGILAALFSTVLGGLFSNLDFFNQISQLLGLI